MRRLLALLALLPLAGCVGDTGAATQAPASSETPPTVEPATPAAPGASAEVVVPLAFDGRIGTVGMACVQGPVARCAGVPVAGGENDLVLEGQRGRIAGGEVVIAWEASSPLTRELSAGFMLMAGGDACESVELGGARGSSPLVLQVSPAARGLCVDELVHLWVAGTAWGTQGPLYYQVDLEQAFRVDGSFTLVVG
ncbi:MAG TPA: hypothetical protein VM582_07915 [Candidatus Thermoplasmatota archaeon]|nr:hypothetical protein [Candidatus Thermoplasmatota archaeon]